MKKLILCALMLLCSVDVMAQVVVGKIDVGLPLLNVQVLNQLDASLANTVTLQVTNSDTATYQCAGRVGFFSLASGAEAPDWAVTGQARIPPGGPYIVVQAINPSGSGVGNTLAYDSMSCEKILVVTTQSVKAIQLLGAYSFTTNYSTRTAQLKVAKVLNSSTNTTTGTLRLELWAMPSAYTGTGSVSGYRMAVSQIPSTCGSTGQLGPGVSCNNISITTPWTVPPAGTYYVTLFVSQFSSTCTTTDKYCIADSGNFPGTIVINSGGVPGSSSAGIQMTGSVSYSVNFGSDSVQLNLDSIVNSSSTRTTGSLRIALWATTTPYTGGGINGYRMATASMPASCFGSGAQLGPKQSCNDIVINSSLSNRPPAGNYYVTLIVDEFDSQNCPSTDKFCIATSRNFTNQLSVPAASTPSPTVPAPSGGEGGGGGGISSEWLWMLGGLLLLRAAGARTSSRSYLLFNRRITSSCTGKSRLVFMLAVPSLMLIGCSTPQPASRPVTYQDVNSTGIVSGVGIESQDIAGVTDKMVRDLLATPAVMQRATVPRIIIDSEYFRNESSQPINKNLMTDRLKINLQRAAQGKLLFVSRESAGMVVKERELKRDGVTDTGTTGLTRAQAGADYRLTGRINSLDARSKSSGMVERLSQISFELIDLESSISIWADIYEFKKGGLDDAVYR